MKQISISLINFYQIFLSFDTGLLRILVPGGACKYPVHCSEYTKAMITEFGVVKGIRLGFMRILSCNNWRAGWN